MAKLLLLYLNNFIENTKMVEELLNQLKHMKKLIIDSYHGSINYSG